MALEQLFYKRNRGGESPEESPRKKKDDSIVYRRWGLERHGVVVKDWGYGYTVQPNGGGRKIFVKDDNVVS